METFDAEVNKDRYGEETMLSTTFADGSLTELISLKTKQFDSMLGISLTNSK